MMKSQYVTGFGKRCIVHTSDFEYLEINSEWYTEMKCVGKIEEQWFYNPRKFHIYLANIPNRCYESPKLKKWMCELCSFSQIWSHISSIFIVYIRKTDHRHATNLHLNMVVTLCNSTEERKSLQAAPVTMNLLAPRPTTACAAAVARRFIKRSFIFNQS